MIKETVNGAQTLRGNKIDTVFVDAQLQNKKKDLEQLVLNIKEFTAKRDGLLAAMAKEKEQFLNDLNFREQNVKDKEASLNTLRENLMREKNLMEEDRNMVVSRLKELQTTRQTYETKLNRINNLVQELGK